MPWRKKKYLMGEGKGKKQLEEALGKTLSEDNEATRPLSRRRKRRLLGNKERVSWVVREEKPVSLKKEDFWRAKIKQLRKDE